MTSKEDLVAEDLLPARKSRLLLCSLTVLSTLGGFLFGYDTGVVSGAMLLIKKDFEISSLWHELIVSSTIAAALVFSLWGGWCVDRYGRKPTILFSGIVFITGSIIMGIAQNKEILLIGRLVVGIAIGVESMSVPVYLAECSEPHQRGLLITIYQLLLTFGMLAANIVGGIFSEVPQGWRYMLGLAAVPSLLQFCGFLLMPESPRWLASKQRYDDAVKVLFSIRGSMKEAEQELAAIQKNFDEKDKQLKEAEAVGGGRSLVVRVFSSRPIRRALFVGCSLQALQQLIGINTVMYYSATIIRMAGVQEESMAIWLSAVTAAINCMCTSISICLVERVGRRRLVLCSLIGIILSCVLLGVGFQLMKTGSPLVTVIGKDAVCGHRHSCYDCTNNEKCGFCFLQSNGTISGGSCWQLQESATGPRSGPCMSPASPDLVWASGWCPNEYAWLTILAMGMYLISFSPGMGPMPWAMNAEIYPLWARGFCTSIATSVNWTANLIISATFLSLMEAVSRAGAFYIYAVIAVFALGLFWCTLPETVGRTLEDLETAFDGKWFDIRGRKSAEAPTAADDIAMRKGNHDRVEIKIETTSS